MVSPEYVLSPEYVSPEYVPRNSRNSRLQKNSQNGYNLLKPLLLKNSVYH